jgi:hypothetical protein
VILRVGIEPADHLASPDGGPGSNGLGISLPQVPPPRLRIGVCGFATPAGSSIMRRISLRLSSCTGATVA